MTIYITTILLSFVTLLVVIAGMAVGVLNGRKAISGSCGGLGNGRCELCSGHCRRREKS
jgi:hypothetical protein